MGQPLLPPMPKGEPYLRHQPEVLDSAGQPSCTRALPYVKPSVSKPRMPRKAAGAMVRALYSLQAHASENTPWMPPSWRPGGSPGEVPPISLHMGCQSHASVVYLQNPRGRAEVVNLESHLLMGL